MKNRLSRSLLLTAALASTSSGDAHEVRPAYLQIDETVANRFDVLWKQPSAGPVGATSLTPNFSNGFLSLPPDEEYSSNSFVIRRWRDCSTRSGSLDGATLSIYGLEDTSADTLVNIQLLSGQKLQTVLKPSSRELVIHFTGIGNLPIAAYLKLGIQHILTGFDHLSFVLGILLLFRGHLILLGAITAFTAAHSITLASAALGYVHVSPPAIECLVALSILCLAIEIVRSIGGQISLIIRYPWLITGSFGLLHGFAFAGSLADVGLPRHNLLGALLFFNCGIEIGQLMFVAVIVVIIAAIKRVTRHASVNSLRLAMAYGIGSLASYWTFARLYVLIQ